MKLWLPVALLLLAMALPALADDPAIPDGYLSAAEATRDRGRTATEYFAAGDATRLHGLLNARLADGASLNQIQEIVDEILGVAPIGARIDEAVWPGTGVSVYAVDREWARDGIGLKFAFDPDRKIAGFFLQASTVDDGPNAAYQTRNRLCLPFDGDWWVYWGGRTALRNYHVVAPDQRYAYDFAAWQQGATHAGDGSQNEQYWAWGRPVLAPGDAIVITARDGVADNRPQVQTQNAASPAGNHVILDFGSGEFALIAHFQRGTLRVKAGDRVMKGQVLGLCGNSGNSSEPHVHIHLQNGPGLFAAAGLPLMFTDYMANGERVAKGEPLQGQFVRQE